MACRTSPVVLPFEPARQSRHGSLSEPFAPRYFPRYESFGPKEPTRYLALAAPLPVARPEHLLLLDLSHVSQKAGPSPTRSDCEPGGFPARSVEKAAFVPSIRQTRAARGALTVQRTPRSSRARGRIAARAPGSRWATFRAFVTIILTVGWQNRDRMALVFTVVLDPF
jgi:hypothetical protein